jgi:hypothetical protein
VCIGLHVKCPSFLTDFNETWIFSTDFRKIPNINLHENPFSGSRIVPCGQTDMTKLTVDFRNFANEHKNFYWLGHVYTRIELASRWADFRKILHRGLLTRLRQNSSSLNCNKNNRHLAWSPSYIVGLIIGDCSLWRKRWEGRKKLRPRLSSLGLPDPCPPRQGFRIHFWTESIHTVHSVRVRV